MSRYPVHTVLLRTKQTSNACLYRTPNAKIWPVHFCQCVRVTCFRQLLITVYAIISIFTKMLHPSPFPRQPKKGATLHPHCPISLQWAFFNVSKVVVAERFYCNSSWIYLVFTPSNIPVLMKNGQTTVVWTPVFLVTPSSIIRDSSKPTASNLDAQ